MDDVVIDNGGGEISVFVNTRLRGVHGLRGGSLDRSRLALPPIFSPLAKLNEVAVGCSITDIEQ